MNDWKEIFNCEPAFGGLALYHCEASQREAVAIHPSVIARALLRRALAISYLKKTQKRRLLRRFAPRNDNGMDCHCWHG